MTVPGRLEVAADGRITGPAKLAYNTPFPTRNGSFGSGRMQGVVMHTMVGNLPGTVEVFNEAKFEASAHFGIAQNGHIHQFGPIGKGWIAWAQMAGNAAWYSIEHADNADTRNPLTEAQIIASAQLVEVLSRFAGFPLEVTNSVDGRGYGTHVMGGAAWGGHTCPGPGPRAGQRAEIIDLAKNIRAGDKAPHYGDEAAVINRKLDHIIKTQEKIMSEQQAEVDAATAQFTELDTDFKNLTAQVTAGQSALDTAIENLQAQLAASGQPVDLSQLVAAQAVVAGDQPNLDAAVAALAADPNAAPAS